MRTYLRRWCVRIIPIGGVVAGNEPILSRRNAEGTRVSAEASTVDRLNHHHHQQHDHRVSVRAYARNFPASTIYADAEED